MLSMGERRRILWGGAHRCDAGALDGLRNDAVDGQSVAGFVPAAKASGVWPRRAAARHRSRCGLRDPARSPRSSHRSDASVGRQHHEPTATVKSSWLVAHHASRSMQCVTRSSSGDTRSAASAPVRAFVISVGARRDPEGVLDVRAPYDVAVLVAGRQAPMPEPFACRISPQRGERTETPIASMNVAGGPRVLPLREGGDGLVQARRRIVPVANGHADHCVDLQVETEQRRRTDWLMRCREACARTGRRPAGR